MNKKNNNSKWFFKASTKHPITRQPQQNKTKENWKRNNKSLAQRIISQLDVLISWKTWFIYNRTETSSEQRKRKKSNNMNSQNQKYKIETEDEFIVMGKIKPIKFLTIFFHCFSLALFWCRWSQSEEMGGSRKNSIILSVFYVFSCTFACNKSLLLVDQSTTDSNRTMCRYQRGRWWWCIYEH